MNNLVETGDVFRLKSSIHFLKMKILEARQFALFETKMKTVTNIGFHSFFDIQNVCGWRNGENEIPCANQKLNFSIGKQT